jgi:regulator of protease activity HflC (stomatin/prohibitin superfamily)
LGIEAAESLLYSLARRELVAVVAGTPIDLLYGSGRAAAERGFAERLSRAVARQSIGCEIVDARLLDVHAPADVHEAFREVASALEDREREILLAAGYAAERSAESAGAAFAVLEAARAEAERAVTLSQATGEAFSSIAQEQLRAPYLTETRLYLEAIERSLATPRKYVQGAPTSGGKVDLWIGGPPPDAPVAESPAEEAP